MNPECPTTSGKDDDHAQSLLRYQLAPSLILDAVGTVIAINSGGSRLLRSSFFSGNHTHSSIVGQNISHLSIAISPTGSPALWTWDQILTAAANDRTETEDDVQRTEDPSFNRNVFQDSEDFWDLEARKRCLIETNAYLVKNVSHASASRTSGSAQDSLKIKARASVCWYPPGVFLVVFNRVSVPSLGKKPSPAAGSRSYLDVQTIAPTNAVPSPTNETKAQYRTPGAIQVTSLIPYIMAVLDMEGQVVRLSDFWYQFTKLSEEESLGSGWISAIHPDDAVAMTSAWADILQHKRRNWTHEARYLEAATGEYYWFLIRAQVYEDESGQAVCWYASMMDINDAVIARQEVDRRRQSMLTLISRTDVLLWGIDKWNQLFIREGGLRWDPPGFLSSSETVQMGQNSQGSKHSDHEELLSVVQAILAGREFTPVVEHTEGGRYFRTIFVAERGVVVDKDAITEAALALTFETTDQVVQSALRIENERLALDEKAALEASALKSRFLANMSHEIRTPISGIIGLSELLRDSNITKDQADLVRDIRSSALFLLELVNDILDLSKIESGQLSIERIPFSPREMIRDTLVPLQSQAKKKGLDLKWTHRESNEPTLLGDPHRIRQVLTNLVGNSIKFTHKGTIHVNVRAVHKTSGLSDVQFIVQDSGIGIAEDARRILFQPFSQADTSTARIYGGTGLGLSICQELVALMGGHMTIQSTLGKGTEVTVNLPFQLYHTESNGSQTALQLPDRTQPGESTKSVAVAQLLELEPTQEQPQSCCAGPSTSGTNLFVLIVDDNAINRKINSRFIAKCGHGVATASNGQEAWDYLCKMSRLRQPDIIFMDCMMPVVDGYEASRRIRSDKDLFDERTRTLPIVAITASGLQSDRERCWDVGMNDFIYRPVSQKTLNDAVLKWTAARDT